MAMLAEPKRRQKYGNDPRNTLWSNDENKFGFRMLESMGWKKGKGLGANESGMTEHVRAVHRNNTDVRGVGCSKSHADKWIAHQDDFNSLLTSLNSDLSAGTSTETISSSSAVNLEEKSKSSKSRVHYQKFTRGKDLSGRSSTDLDCIFGKRKIQSLNSSSPIVQSEANSDEDSCEGRPSFKQDDNSNSSSDSNTFSHGIKTITSSSSVQEYFAMKMAQLKQKREEATYGSDKCEGCGTDSKNNNVGEGTDAVSVLVVGGAEANGENMDQAGKKKKKKKSKKSGEDSGEESPQETGLSVEVPLEDQADAEGEQVKSRSKKKGRKNKGIVKEVDYDLNDSCMPSNEVSSEDKNGREGTDTRSMLGVDGVESTEESSNRVGKKKKKKSKRSDNDSEEKSCDVILGDQAVLEDAGEEQEENKPKKKGKKDKSFVSKTDSDLNDNCIPPKHSAEEEQSDSVRSRKQKRKSKKHMHVESSLSESIELTEEEKPADKKFKKTNEKSSVDSATLSNSVEQAELDVNQVCDNEDSFTLLSKKSKKKKKIKKSNDKQETTLNTSILRCEKDRKRRRTKSVSFSVGGDEIFMIPAKEDIGQAGAFETNKEEEANLDENPSKTRNKKRKKGKAEHDYYDEDVNMEEKPPKTKNLKRKRGRTDSDEETIPKKKKKSVKQEEKLTHRKRKRSVKTEEDSSDDQMSKENNQAQQVSSGKGEGEQELENLPAGRTSSKKKGESRNNAKFRETVSKETALQSAVGNTDNGSLVSLSCNEVEKQSNIVSPSVSKVSETNNNMSVFEESANPKDRSAQQDLPGKGKGEQTLENVCANTSQRKPVEEAGQNACSNNRKEVVNDKRAVLEEKFKMFTGANLESIKGYGC